MRRLSSFVWLLLFLCPIAAPGQPRLELMGGTTFSFGEVYTGTTVSRDLTLKNRGTDTLVISDVSAGCGCTGTLMSSDRIAPGGSGVLSISFNSKKLSGEVQKVVTLNTNDTGHGHVRISFTANVIKSLSIDPEYLVFRTRVDSAAGADLSIVNVGPSAVRILSASSSDDRLSLTLTADRIDPGHESVLKCTLKPKSEGLINGTIAIVTDRPKIPTINVRFFALVGGKTAPAAASDHN